MRVLPPAIILMVSMVFFLGCGNLNSIHHFLTVDEGTGAMVDIKQRAILVSKRPIKSKPGEKSTYPPQMQTIVCTEPSPDALSAYAAELAAEGGVPGKVAAKLAGATQEGAAYVGLRTPSIQLLRDSLYRLCEGYMSGALTDFEYGLYTRRYQRFMIALLGIEQLTGALRTPSVTIQTQGKAQAAGSIADMRKEIERIGEDLAAQKESKAELTEQLKAASGDAEKTKRLQAKLDVITKAITDKQEDKVDIEKAIKEERTGLVAAGSSATSVSGVGLPAQRSDAHIQKVASVVENIVIKAMDIDDKTSFCWNYLTQKEKNAEKTVVGGQAAGTPNVSQASVRNARLVLTGNANQAAGGGVVFKAEEIDSLKKLCYLTLSQKDRDRVQKRHFNQNVLALFREKLAQLPPEAFGKMLASLFTGQQGSPHSQEPSQGQKIRDSLKNFLNIQTDTMIYNGDVPNSSLLQDWVPNLPILPPPIKGSS